MDSRDSGDAAAHCRGYMKAKTSLRRLEEVRMGAHRVVSLLEMLVNAN